mgnify:CR=1 FL=1
MRLGFVIADQPFTATLEDNPCARDLLSMLSLGISTLMSGYSVTSLAIAGQRLVSAACSDAVRRILPERALPQIAQRVEFSFDLLDARTDGMNESFAGFGRRNAPRGAGQQAHPRDAPRAHGQSDSVPTTKLRDALRRV